MTEQRKLYPVNVKLDPEHLEYLKKNNIDPSEFARKLIDDLIEKEAEEIAKLRELMKKYPEIAKEEN